MKLKSSHTNCKVFLSWSILQLYHFFLVTRLLLFDIIYHMDEILFLQQTYTSNHYNQQELKSSLDPTCFLLLLLCLPLAL